jgi:predicted MarR family transcription regulator
MSTQIKHVQYVRHDLREKRVRDLQFLDDDDDRMKTTMIGLMEYALKMMTLGAYSTKR